MAEDVVPYKQYKSSETSLTFYDAAQHHSSVSALKKPVRHVMVNILHSDTSVHARSDEGKSVSSEKVSTFLTGPVGL
jgi:hypothetical protein